MRTHEEIQRQIKGIIDLRNSLPEFSAFGDNNYEPLDTMIDILHGTGNYADYEDAEDAIESAAYEATEWLEGNINEGHDDLFE